MIKLRSIIGQYGTIIKLLHPQSLHLAFAINQLEQVTNHYNKLDWNGITISSEILPEKI